jgi:hypothetical protein
VKFIKLLEAAKVFADVNSRGDTSGQGSKNKRRQVQDRAARTNRIYLLYNADDYNMDSMIRQWAD